MTCNHYDPFTFRLITPVVPEVAFPVFNPNPITWPGDATSGGGGTPNYSGGGTIVALRDSGTPTYSGGGTMVAPVTASTVTIDVSRSFLGNNAGVFDLGGGDDDLFLQNSSLVIDISGSLEFAAGEPITVIDRNRDKFGQGSTYQSPISAGDVVLIGADEAQVDRPINVFPGTDFFPPLGAITIDVSVNPDFFPGNIWGEIDENTEFNIPILFTFELVGVSPDIELHVEYNPDHLIEGKPWADTLVGDNPLGNVILGYGGDDVIIGTDAQDQLRGHGGRDVIHAGGGDDALFGGVQNDRLFGGQGDDALYGDEGYDFLYGGTGSDELHGGSENDRLYGQGDDDMLYGDTGYDFLHGGEGSDFLIGGHGNDRLYGENGDDALVGGVGFDHLWGGAGADRFTISSENGHDTIYDFEASEGDILDIACLLDQYDSVSDAITDFINIRAYNSGSLLQVDVDGGGDSFESVAYILNVGDLGDVEQLVADGTLIVA